MWYFSLRGSATSLSYNELQEINCENVCFKINLHFRAVNRPWVLAIIWNMNHCVGLWLIILIKEVVRSFVKGCNSMAHPLITWVRSSPNAVWILRYECTRISLGNILLLFRHYKRSKRNVYIYLLSLGILLKVKGRI